MAWITREVQDIVPLAVPEGTTVGEAIAASQLVQTYGLDLSALMPAVAGKRRRMDAAVHEGERIDLLRPLVADPKETRRRRAAQQKTAAPDAARRRSR
ncbi:MAG TPA: RnfH family protein [Casimicrobiaceae bacterium]|nr:RnfH family protein [Casimicrobiaceae bacterium]